MPNTHFLTLVASNTPLSESIIGGVELLLLDHGLKGTAPRTWLSEKKALDIELPKKPDETLLGDIKNILEHVQIDHFISPKQDRRKKLLVADMDSTIVAEETLDEVAAEFKLRPMISAITQSAMRGEIDFDSSLRKRVALLAGRPIKTMEKVRDNTILNAGAKTLVGTMRRHGARCVLVSGGFTYFTSSVAERCNFHHHHGNDLPHKDGKITGFLDGPILNPKAKLAFMKEYMTPMRLKPRQVMAIGDGANDREIIKYAGLGIGYYPTPVLEKATQNVIRYGDLTAALYAQGFKEKEFRRPSPHKLALREE